MPRYSGIVEEIALVDEWDECCGQDRPAPAGNIRCEAADEVLGLIERIALRVGKLRVHCPPNISWPLAAWPAVEIKATATRLARS
jgi:hypothetical protein